ncbi:hypothetical protein BH11PSE12_BH11PSE12_23600 [soil metagenome]
MPPYLRFSAFDVSSHLYWRGVCRVIIGRLSLVVLIFYGSELPPPGRFCGDFVRDALRSAIAKVKQAQLFLIAAWVLLPDHLHCLWAFPEGDTDVSTGWIKIKCLVSIACAENYHRPDLMSVSKQKLRESTIWQRQFYERQIRDDRDFSQHSDYAHVNPIKHGLVSNARDWS